MEIKLDAVASTLNLIGGLVLAVDAFRARGTAEEKEGNQVILAASQEAGTEGDIRNARGQVKWNAFTEEVAMAMKTFVSALTGALFLVAGFALDIATKCFGNPVLFH